MRSQSTAQLLPFPMSFLSHLHQLTSHRLSHKQKWLCLESNHLLCPDPKTCWAPWIIGGNEQMIFMLETYVNNWSKFSGIHPVLQNWAASATHGQWSPPQRVLFMQANSQHMAGWKDVFRTKFQMVKKQGAGPSWCRKCGCGYSVDKRTALLMLNTWIKVRCGEQPLGPHTAKGDSSIFVSLFVYCDVLGLNVLAKHL